jgi:biopolymer transport protein ExbB
MKKFLLLFALALLTPAVSAQPADLDALLRDIREVRNTEQTAMRERETRFLAERDEQQSRLRQAEEALAQVQAEADRLKSEFDRQEQALTEGEAQLAQRSGNLGELFGVVRQAADDTRSQWQDSLLNMQFPGRTATLDQLAGSRQIPTVEALESFWFLLQQDMTASGKISRFMAPVVGLDGSQRELSVIRVGPFVALQGEDYLLYQPEPERLLVAARQPEGRGLVDDFMQPRNELADLKVDPTRGNVIQQLQQTPSLTERIHQGGVVGYVIIALGLLGLLLALVRLVWLQRTSGRVSRQVADLGDLRRDNPLGRVLELKLDEAILKETPALERWQGLIKLVAAVAPLLGLLGTVTGMIATFQAITLFGTGDPKLMAGGISQALITTVLGLIVAIPLLFMHGLVAARSKALIQLLEQQSAGLMALHLGGEDEEDV